VLSLKFDLYSFSVKFYVAAHPSDGETTRVGDCYIRHC